MSRNYKEIINSSINDFIDYTNPLQKIMSYSLLGESKRVRSILFLMILDYYGLNYEKYLNFSIAIEYIHSYSLVHDDLPEVDDSDFRRNRHSCHVEYGHANALFCGDALVTDAFGILCDCEFVKENNMIEIIKLWSRYFGSSGLVLGQFKDINKNFEYFDIIYLKTSSFFELICITAQKILENSNLVDEWSLIGRYMGDIYQINDDLSDCDVSVTKEYLETKLAEEKKLLRVLINKNINQNSDLYNYILKITDF
ncbi:MAG: polyprenyl synthetase family protein [Bacilli bacterium]|nr:polyprenyl synthetase family protein [Bacilli bacterium]